MQFPNLDPKCYLEYWNPGSFRQFRLSWFCVMSLSALRLVFLQKINCGMQKVLFLKSGPNSRKFCFLGHELLFEIR